MSPRLCACVCAQRARSAVTRCVRMCRLCSGTGREVSPTHCPFLSAQSPMQMGSSLQWQLVVVAPVALSLSLSFLFSSGYHWLAHKHSVRRCCCSVAAAASLAASEAQARQHQHTHSHIQQQQLCVLCSFWNISPYCVYSAAHHISTTITIVFFQQLPPQPQPQQCWSQFATF